MLKGNSAAAVQVLPAVVSQSAPGISAIPLVTFGGESPFSKR